MLKAVLGLVASLPLGWFHAIGAGLGWIVYAASPVYAARLRENLVQSGICSNPADCRKLLRRAIREAGKSVAELIVVWFRKSPSRLVRECRGWEHVEAARGRGRGIIFLTPHLGCYEISSLYAAEHFSITVLYRPPKLRWLEPLMVAGRMRGKISLATTDLKGVRTLLRALKHGEAIGLLPDQAPGQGEGEWADFFGRPAYTMTLAAKLAERSGASVLLAFSKRLQTGEGFVIHVRPMPGQYPAAPKAAALNAAVEELIRECPEQYLWSYNRYKVPAGVEPPVRDS